MKNYININESVDVDIDVDLRDHIDEIVEFISHNDEIKQKLIINKIIPTLKRKENIKKNNPFKLTNDEFDIHLTYVCKDGFHKNLKNHLLIKDDKIVGIISTNAHLLIITSDNDNIVDLIKNKEVSLKTFCLTDNLIVKNEIELDLIDGDIYQHISIKDDFSVQNEIIEDALDIEIIIKIISDLKDKELKLLGNDYKVEKRSKYNVVCIDDKTFNETYFNDAKKLLTANDPFYYFLDERKLNLKNKRNFVAIMQCI